MWRGGPFAIRGIIEMKEGVTSDQFVQFSILCVFGESTDSEFSSIFFFPLWTDVLRDSQVTPVYGIVSTGGTTALGWELQNSWHQGNRSRLITREMNVAGPYPKTPLHAIVMNGWNHSDVLQLLSLDPVPYKSKKCLLWSLDSDFHLNASSPRTLTHTSRLTLCLHASSEILKWRKGNSRMPDKVPSLTVLPAGSQQ